MAKIKRAQAGGKFSISEAKRKRDSLNYDAALNAAAGRNRVVEKGWDDISRELISRSQKSDSLKNVFDKAINKATKATPKNIGRATGTMKKGGSIKKSYSPVKKKK